MEIPEFNMKVAADAEQIHLVSRVDGVEKKIDHNLPEDKLLRRLIDLHRELDGWKSR